MNDAREHLTVFRSMPPSPRIPRSLRSVGERFVGGWLLLLLVLGGVLLSAFAAFWVNEAHKRSVEQEFARRTLVRHQFLAESFVTYESVLFTLRLVVENNRHLELHEFERASIDIQKRAPGILALQWAPLVERTDLASFTDRVREILGPDFTPREMTPAAGLVPLTTPSSRPQHAIITYVYPLAGNESTLGYDIFTAPTAPDLRRAMQTGQSTLTRPLQLVQGAHGVILTALANRDSPAESAEPPLSGPGFVQVVIHLDRMLGQLWNIKTQNHTDFALYDASGRELVPLFAQLAGTQSAMTGPLPSYETFACADTITHDLQIGGRTWRACYRPSPQWLSENKTGFTHFVLFGGILLTFCSAAFLDQFRRRAQHVEKEVCLRTAELNDSRALLDSVIEHSPSAIWVKDSNLRYFLVNEQFCRTYARDRSSLIGQNDDQLHPPDIAAEMERLDREVLNTGCTLNFEGTYTVLGQPRTYLVGKFPLRRADGSIYAIGGVATDITALHQAEADKTAMERRLLESQKLESLGVLAGGIAHDFNNLLTGILGHASLLSATLPRSSGAHASIAQIEASSRRAADLCRHMLAYSGRGHYVFETFDLSSLVRDVLLLVQPDLAKNARLHTALGQDLPPITADFGQLSQAVKGLVINASESLGEQGGEITVRTQRIRGDARLFATCVHAPSLPSGDYLALEITDTGVGMDTATLGRIFDPFFTTKFAGRGLGLAAVLGIIRGHHGAIRVTSKTGHGTTFQLYLPVSEEKAAPSALPKPAAKSTPGQHLLLVDDETTVREIAAQLLEAIGYNTTTAENGKDAMQRFHASPDVFDAALIDLTMPDLDGGEVMKLMRAQRPDLPVILMSGYDEKDAAGLLAAPRTLFLAKPFTLDALRAKITALLAAR
jgi:PAS domain S-box-containing protein